MALGTSPLDRRPRRRATDASGPPDAVDGTRERADDADPVEAARGICLRLLTIRPRTRAELSAALARKGVADDVAETVLDRLVEVRLVDDAAYAAHYVEARHRDRGLARRALSAELKRRGVADDDVATAVAELPDAQEAETAAMLVRKRLAATRGLDQATRMRRLTGLLQRKGYPMGMAMQVIRTAFDEERAAE